MYGSFADAAVPNTADRLEKGRGFTYALQGVEPLAQKGDDTHVASPESGASTSGLLLQPDVLQSGVRV